MLKVTETPDLIEAIIAEMPLSLIGEEWVDNGGGSYSINTCDTKWLQPSKSDCFKLVIDGNDYKITSVQNDQSITVKGDVLPTSTTFDVYAPKYFHGTITQVTVELDNFDYPEEKLPLIYLNEGIQETFFTNDNPASRESDIRIFFLTEYNAEDWQTSNDFEAAKIPMRKLAYAFIEAVQKSTLTLRLDSFNIINRDKMAVSVSQKGSTQKIFNDNLSGCDVGISISFSKEACKC